MPERRTRYKFNVMRLIVSLAVVIGVVVGFFMVVGGGEEPLAAAFPPADPPCYTGCAGPNPIAYTFPLAGAQRDAFEGIRIEQKESLIDSTVYAQNSGKPITFQAYIPLSATDPTSDPDYFTKDGMTYIASYYAPWNESATAQRIIAGGGNLPENERILLGFPDNMVPDSSQRFIRVWGYMSWVSTELNPTSQSQFWHPVVTVGAWDPLSAAEVVEPATWQAFPPFAAKRDRIAVSVLGVDFSPKMTRVKVRILFDGAGAGEYPIDSARLTVDGVPQPQQAPRDLPVDEGTELGGSDLVTNKPREATLFFPGISTPSSSRIDLVLPDPSGGDNDVIVLRLTPRPVPNGD